MTLRPSDQVRLAVKMTVAGTMSWWLANLAGEPQPIFAAFVPLVAMSADPFSAVNVSIARVLGVFVGVGIGVGALTLPVPALAQVGLTLASGTLAGILLRFGGRPNVQAAVTALFTIALGKMGAVAGGVTRMWETAIGAVVTIVVAALLWPADPVRELAIRLDRLRTELVGDLAAIADDLATGNGAATARLIEMRGRSLDAVRDFFELGRARSTLRWNPVRRGDVGAFMHLEKRIRLGARVYRHARALARDVADAPTSVRGAEVGRRLASAVAGIIEATEAELRGDDGAAPLERTARELTAIDATGDALIVGAQLRQMLADVRELT